MRIGDRYQSLMDTSSKVGAARTPPAGASDAKPARGNGSAVEVKVSDRAAELAESAQKLEQLKARIKNGSFKVDAQAIASKLVGGDDE